MSVEAQLPMRVRAMAPAEAPLVAAFFDEAPEYWHLAEGHLDPGAKAQAFFAEAPPGCDPAGSLRLGGFLGDRLSGVSELSFGFPERDDAYLGLMLLGPWAQGQGHQLQRLVRDL
jgi:hypothetical protein